MEERGRSVGSSEVVVKNRNSSGCLIVRRKGDALAGGQGASDSRKVYMSKKEKKRRGMLMSDSGSSDEMLAAARRRVGPETVRVCNDLNAFREEDAEESEFGKRERSERNGDGFFDNNGVGENERKRSKLGVFDFDEYDSVDGGRMQSPYYDESGVAFGERRFLGSTHMSRKIDREFEAGSSRHMVEKQRNEYFERMSSVNRGHSSGRIRVESNREGFSLRDKHGGSSEQAIRLQGKNGVLKVMVNKKKSVGGSVDKYKFHKAEEHPKGPRAEDFVKKNVAAPPFYPEEKIPKKPGGYVIGSEKKLVNSRKPFPTKNNKSSNWESEDSDASLKPEPETAVRSSKKVTVEKDYTPCEKVTPNTPKDGKVRRGSGTEKQKLRERIRGMLVDAGWTIDYRPRRNRDYLDAVYINPSGTAYWSIIKAYEALQKQVNEDNEPKPSADGSSLKLIANEDLSQLTRKTRKKIEQEMKRKRRDGSDSEDAKETRVRWSTSKKHDSESMDSASHDDKLSSFMKQGGKSFKSRMNENGFASVNSSGRNSQDIGERPDSGSNSPLLHGRKSRKFGRCTLLVRSSNKGLNSETDGFVPYTGKRTILSWLVDSGTVQLSQKVQYKNRRRSRVFLDGWITRDGIHCRCCSKILPVSKFEIHAASKLRQPYQNIVLDSGVSLIQCQVDAWERQEGSEHDGFHSVDVDGDDDPNDDTCGICGDGGDLICCDGCPSTFHQNCLDIEMPPPGDWHCPNCTCKFCGSATETLTDEDDTASTLHSCSLCEKKYHESCVEDIESSSDDSGAADQHFCGLKCKELSEQLQKYSDTKHELEGGFSWSLIRRMDHRMIPQRVECNSKLAVALTVMDECFMPVFDRRSGINIIRSVLYNCGSNFNRLNYSGFYTAILEKGDEIICAASLRFHGNKLAEMPFIGTRHIYRRQGMCRRLFSVIESALCSLKVEKLVIPAISELTQTWTEVFGFTPLEEALKCEMRSMNMLVFPGIDMLQKIIGDQEHGANIMTNKDAKHIECEDEQSSEPEVAAKPDIGSLTETDPKGCDETDLSHHLNETTTEEVAARVEPVSVDNAVGSVKLEIDSSTTSDSQGRGDNTGLNHYPKMEGIAVESGFEGAEMSDKKLDTSSIHVDSVPIGGAEISETTTVCENSSPLKVTHDVVTEKKPLPEIVLEDTVVVSVSSNITQKLENPDPINNGNACFASDSSGGVKVVSETPSDFKKMSPPPELHHDDGVVTGNEPFVSSDVSPKIGNSGPIDVVTVNKPFVLSDISQKIENPDPTHGVPGNEPFGLSVFSLEIENQDFTYNGPVSTDSPSRANISETKSPSKMIQDDDAGIEKNTGQDLIVERKTESW